MLAPRAPALDARIALRRQPEQPTGRGGLHKFSSPLRAKRIASTSGIAAIIGRQSKRDWHLPRSAGRCGLEYPPRLQAPCREF